jgi:uncharacterized membrane protein YtjA (UPF0391 family)
MFAALGRDQAARANERAQRKVHPMLYWSVVFFVLALVAAVFGFGGIAASATGIAKILFVGFLILAAISLIAGRRPSSI